MQNLSSRQRLNLLAELTGLRLVLLAPDKDPPGDRYDDALAMAISHIFAELPQKALLSDPESRILVQLVGGLALIHKFEPKALRRRTTRQIQEACKRFGFGMSKDTVRPWVCAAVAYVMCPEQPVRFPTKAKGPFPTKVKGTLRMLIQGMIADRYVFSRPFTDGVLLEILNDLDGVGVKMALADLREALDKIDEELGKPEIVE